MSIVIEHTFNNHFSDLIGELLDKCDPEMLMLEGIHPDQLDINKATREFFKRRETETHTADISIDANANVSGKDTITYAYELAKPISKLNSLYNLWLWLNELYGDELADTAIKAQVYGSVYINDLWDTGRPYCFNFSTYDIACEGLKMSNRLTVDPPKSLATFLRQVEQFVVYAGNSTLGATGLADLLIVAAGYCQKFLDELDPMARHDGHINVTQPHTYIKEQLTSLIYTLNWEFRGNQSAFTNVSVYDRPFLENLVSSYVVLGKPVSIENVQLIQDIYLEVMDEILDRTPITFPVTTACFSVEDRNGRRVIRDENFLRRIAEANVKHGFINIYMGKSSTLSSCCRLRSDNEDLGYTNSFGSGSTKIGSLGVVTLNLPRVAALALDDDEDDPFEAFLQSVIGGVVLASRINHAKRAFISDRIKRGSLPLYTLGLMDLKRQYATCGITGLYEALEILGYDIATEEGLKAAQHVLAIIQKTNRQLQAKTGIPHNMEQVPAETAAVKLAAKDRLLGILDYDMYSNQFVPLTAPVSLFTRLEIQGALDKYCDGGSVLHINAAQPIPHPAMMGNLIRQACEHGVVYFAINYVLCQCENGHLFVSDKGNLSETCPHCGGKITDEYTRVVGFLTNTKHWNKVRREKDYPDRKFYKKV